MKDKTKKLKKRAGKLLEELAKSLEANKGEMFKGKFTGEQLSQLLGCVQHKLDWVIAKPLDKKKAVNETNMLERASLQQLQQQLLEILAGK